MFKFHKLKKALAVCKDLDTLDFKFNSYGWDNTLYTIIHPSDKYSIWTANGFWFCALYQIDGVDVNSRPISKFGAIGRVLVWWKCKKQISRFHNEKLEKCQGEEKRFLEFLLEEEEV